MKKHTAYTAVVLAIAVLAGCSGAAKVIDAKSRSERTDVFTEATAGVRSQGFVDMVLKANIKTHEAGYYIGESSKSLHGKAGYPFVLNIDGQAVVWNVDGQKDVKPAYDENNKTSKDPEARTGIKYLLEKTIRLRPGAHKVYFGLPEDNYIIEADIAVGEGEESVLEFKPVYRYKTRPTRIPAFLEGIRAYEVYLNGVKIK
ncbi:MAG: hypothetical protein ACYC7L_06375 [Nitrospirota bacterium]